MKELKEIFRIVSGHKVRRPFEPKRVRKGERGWASWRLWEGLAQGAFDSDEDAAQAIYGVSAKEKKWGMLKGRFRDGLLGNLSFVDDVESSYSGYFAKYIECLNNLPKIAILGARGGRSSGSSLAKKTNEIGLKYQFHDVVIFCSHFLRDISAHLGHFTQFDFYNDLIESSIKKKKAEELSEELYMRLAVKITRSATVEKSLINLTEDYLRRVVALSTKHNTYIVEFNKLRLHDVLLQMQAKYKDAIKVLDDIENFLNANMYFDRPLHRGEIAMKKLVCCVQLRNYDEGMANALKCFSIYKMGSYNWFFLLSEQFLLSLYCMQLNQAEQSLKEATNHPRFEYTSQMHQEKWIIYEAYLHFAVSHFEHQKTKSHKKINKSFNLPKFLNEVPVYFKDKTGYNVAILIIQHLILLQQRKFAEIIDRAEGLKTYRYRYLRGAEHYRSYYFLKLLLVMEKKGFEYEATRVAAQPWYDKMVSGEARYVQTDSTLEVIPYEDLWGMVLERLRVG